MHKSGIPIDVFLIFIKVHFGVSSYLFKHQSYHLLLLRWKKNVTTSALEILVAPEVEDEVVINWSYCCGYIRFWKLVNPLANIRS